MTVLIVLMVIAVWVLWGRVGSLQRKMQRLEQLFEDLSRSAPQVEPTSSASEASAARSPAPIAAPRPVAPSLNAAPRPSMQETAQGSAGEPAGAWNAPPREPQAESALVRLIRGYFTGGNLIVRVGIIVLFFGVAFLLKYAAEHAHVPIHVRLIGVALGAVALFVLGWRLRNRRRGFSLALQGGSIGVLYLTLFAALRLYQLLAPDLTFALMAALGVVSSLLAIRQDSLAMSFLGATGGFLAPVLASTEQGSHVVLFSYYALLDLGIVAQAWFKAWRPLNLLAFVFTFGVGAAWGVLKYNPTQFATTEPFLLFFFLAFVAVAVLFAFRRAPQLTHYVDGTLVFGTPLAAMALQMELARDIPHGRAISVAVAGLFYMALAVWLHRTRRETMRLLMESFLAMGVAFLTLAVPLWLDDSWTTTTWALEGAALFWIGLRQQRRLSIIGGALLQFAAAITFIALVGSLSAKVPVANASFMCTLFLSVAGLLSARFAAQPNPLLRPFGQIPANLLLIWGLGWWIYTGANELHRFLPAHWLPGALLTFCALTALACGSLVKRLSWPALQVPALSILPLMIAAAAWWLMTIAHPLGEGGWFAWPTAYAVLWCCLWRNENSLSEQARAWMHGVALWMLSLLVSGELYWQVSTVAAANTAWASAVWGLAPAVLLAFNTGSTVEKLWPMRRHPQQARVQWAMGLAVLVGAWSLWLCFASNGNVSPLLYLPLLNPPDIAAGASLLIVARWLWMVWHAESALFRRDQLHMMIGVLVALVFCWLNAVLLRTMHHWRGVPYQIDALLADTAVHTALSIFWTTLALGGMLWANRSLQRIVWFGGATLMAVVVIKLFMVDLASIGTVPRIVSFLVVGGLMLVIGYFSPLPPSPAQRADTA